MKTMKEVISCIIDDKIEYEDEVSKKSILDEMIPIRPVEFVESDGIMKKPRGCFGGPCACTGACMLLVDVTELDVFLKDNLVRMVMELSDDIDSVLAERGFCENIN